MVRVKILVEGITDLAVAKRLLRHVGLESGDAFVPGGKEQLLKQLPRYNKAARFDPL